MTPPLTRAQKRTLIRQLVKSVLADLVADVPRMPSEWDGIELRELIADRFAGQTALSSKSYWGDVRWRNADRKRLREYRNEKLTRNL